MIGAMKREVGAALDVDITAPTTLEVQIAIAPHPNTQVSESLSFVMNGRTVVPLEISGVHGNRITNSRRRSEPEGRLRRDDRWADRSGPVTEYDLSMYLRPSRLRPISSSVSPRPSSVSTPTRRC